MMKPDPLIFPSHGNRCDLAATGIAIHHRKRGTEGKKKKNHPKMCTKSKATKTTWHGMLRNLFTVGSTCFQARCDDCVVVVLPRVAHEGTAKHFLFVARFILKVSLFYEKKSFQVFLSFFSACGTKKQQYVPIVNLSLLSCAFALIININRTACEIRAEPTLYRPTDR